MKKQLLIILSILFSGLMVNAQTQVLADTSLEVTGGGGLIWASTSTNFGTVLCDANCGTCGGPCTPHTGSWYAWFGGSGSAELGTLSQTFNVATAGSGTMHFFLMIPNFGATVDSISATLDGNMIWFKVGTDTAGFESGYAPVTVLLGSLSSGSHTLAWRGLESGTGAGTYNVLIDDITIQVGSGSASTETNLLEEGITMINNSSNGTLDFNYNFGEPTQLTVNVIDIQGKIVATQVHESILNEQTSINTSTWATGVYNVYFRKGNTPAITKKIIIQH